MGEKCFFLCFQSSLPLDLHCAYSADVKKLCVTQSQFIPSGCSIYYVFLVNLICNTFLKGSP